MAGSAVLLCGLLIVLVATVDHVALAQDDFMFPDASSKSEAEMSDTVEEGSGESMAKIALPIDETVDPKSMKDKELSESSHADKFIDEKPMADTRLHADDEDIGSGTEPTERPPIPTTPFPTDRPVSPTEIAYYRVTVNITSEPCSPELSNRNSFRFERFQARFKAAILSILEGLPGRQVINIVQIRCGSLIIQFDIGSQGYASTRTFNSSIKAAIDSGQIGEFATGLLPYEFSVLGAPEPVTPQPRPCDPRSEFTCGSRECIPLQLQCDDQIDCRDASDEDSCRRRCDANQEIDCGDGECIDLRLRCDGRMDCRGGRDEENCGPKAATTHSPPKGDSRPLCPMGYFTCSGGQCLPATTRCNGAKDCYDGSDEWRCPNVHCPPYQHICDGGLRCIDISRLCDGHRDCLDQSDERFCSRSTKGPVVRSSVGPPVISRSTKGSCRLDQFRCRDGRMCLPLTQRCDHILHCYDASDEISCPYSRRCYWNEFQCDNVRCIPYRARCDGFAQCRDGRDEANCRGKGSSCPAGTLPCDRGRRCYTPSQRCDGAVACADRADEIGCAVTKGPSLPQCGTGEIACDRGSTCFYYRQRCDGRVDCKDYTDERNCDKGDSCTVRGQFSCDGGRRCYTWRERCDGFAQCFDQSDEHNCDKGDLCSVRGQISCDGGRRCYTQKERCDSFAQCSDLSDERDCVSTERPTDALCEDDSQFSCYDGKACYSLMQMCDGIADCYDFSDEEGCGCSIGYLTCDSGQVCYLPEQQCDGVLNCQDTTDEICDFAALITVSVTPDFSSISEGSSQYFTCSVSCPSAIPCVPEWGYNRPRSPLPRGVTANGAQLMITRAEAQHAGLYYCSVEGYSESATSAAELVVIRSTGTTCRSDELRCGTGRCVSRSVLCDGDDDCGDGTDELNCIEPDECEPPEFKCRNGNCAQKIWRCDGDDDCRDGTDEQIQYCPVKKPGDNCGPYEHMCASRDQCIPRSFLCDGQVDCQDRSDEIGCSSPIVTIPPVPTITVKIGQTIVINCTAIGKPTPLISWRLNWGNIPTGPRVTETSVDGFGVLTIRDARVTDAGAYTCEAMNNRNAVFGNPDAIVIVEGNVVTCPRGMFNSQAESLSDCKSCYCFGMTTGCRSSGMNMIKVNAIDGITLGDEQGTELARQSVFIYDTISREYSIPYYETDAPSGNLYWIMPSKFLGNQLMSYGGILAYTTQYEARENRRNSAYDVILRGDRQTLYCSSNENFRPGVATSVRLQLVETNCEKRSRGGDIGIPDVVTREDMMKVMVNLEQMLIRATYDSSQTTTVLREVSVESASDRDPRGPPASLIEQCDCPRGYQGTSCEQCQPGFERRANARFPLGECVEVQVCECNGHSNRCDRNGVCLNCQHNTEGTSCERCQPGFERRANARFPQEECVAVQVCECNGHSNRCDRNGVCLNCQHNTEGDRCQYCRPGYEGDARRGTPTDCVRIPEPSQCDASGTLRRDGSRCVCKPYVTGPRCDRCINGAFYLNPSSSGGCLECFCMGVVKNCGSTTQRRNLVTAQYDVDSWSIADSTGRRLLGNVLTQDSRSQLVIADLQSLGEGSYYWKLPSQFTGNLLGAYGGKLRFKANFVAPSTDLPNDDPDIILFGGSGIQFTTDFETIMLDTREYDAEISMSEAYWRRADNDPATHEHMLMALEDVQSILIKASYTRGTLESRISRVSLDVASDSAPRNALRAWEVEECDCPAGYLGSSCETCAPGYTRNPGVYLGICINSQCNCNGHSDDCDSGRDICYNCQHGTTGQNCEDCLPGYVRNVRDRSRFECLNPAELVTVEVPEITVVVGGRATFVCRPFNAELSYRSLVWRRVDNSPLPRTSSQANGRLIIDDVQLPMAGGYSCDIVTEGGISGSGLASLVVIEGGCPIGYENPPTCNRCARGYSRDGRGRCVQSQPNLQVRVNPSTVELVEGDSMTLTCEVTPRSSDITVSWSGPDRARQGIAEVQSDRNVLNNVVSMRVSKEDEGTWFCTANRRSDGASARDYARVTVRERSEGIVVTIEPSGVQRIDAGASARFDCQARSQVGNSVYVVSWSKDGGQLPTTAFERNGELLLQQVTPADSGVYTCTGSNLRETAEQSVTLIVSGGQPATSRPVGTRLLIEPTWISVEPGTSARLQCRLECPSDCESATLTWRSDSGSLNPSATVSRGMFYIPSVREADEQYYYCSTTINGYQILTAKTLIIVHERSELTVRVEPDKLYVTEGGSGVLNCRVVGDARSVVWRKGRGEIAARHETRTGRIQGDTLTFNNFNSDDRGYYYCTANGADAVTTVTSSPTLVDMQRGPVPTERPNPPTGNFVDVLTPDVRVRVNDEARLECRSSANVQVLSIDWTRARAALDSRRSSQSTGILVIRNAQESDSGVYYCTVRLTNGDSQQGTARLTVSRGSNPVERPEVRVHGPDPESNELALREGESGRLMCMIDRGGDSTQITWSKTGDRLESNVRPDGQYLQIYDARFNNAGWYQCRGENAAGTSTAIGYVRISDTPTGTGVGLITGVPEFIDAPLGSSVEIICEVPASGSIQPMVYWKNARAQRLTESTPLISTMTIDTISFSHAGNYTCVAEIPGASSSKSFMLRVVRDIPQTGPIVWNRNPMTISSQINSDVTIDCKPSTSLPTSTEWEREGARILPASAEQLGSRLEFRNLKLSDAGMYVCTAKNSQGTAQLFVTLRVEGEPGTPIVSVNGERLDPNGVKEYDAGSRITLTCLAEGEPTPTYIWSRMSGRGFTPIISSSSVQVQDGTLTIFSASKLDSGYYNCTAFNEFGSREVYSRLVVRSSSAPPVNVVVRGSGDGNQRNLYKPGQDVVLRCTASSTTPISYRWTYNNGPLPDNAVERSAVLKIDDVKQENQGTYYCAVSNAAGSSRPAAAQVYVSGEEPSGVPTAPQPSNREYRQAPNQSVRLQCPLPAGADRIEWARDNQLTLPRSSRQSNRGQTLEIFNLQPSDGGIYYCYATNSNGWSPRVSITVVVQDTTPRRRLDVEERSQVVLQCVRPWNAVRIEWSRENNAALPRRAYRETNSDNLVIPRIRTEDGGIYYCTAFYSNGASQPTSVVVTVLYRDSGRFPTVPQSDDTDVETSPGGSIIMACKTADDSVITWTRRGALMPPLSTFIERPGYSQISIRNIKRSDAGTYECRAKNQYGESEPLVHTIIVTGSGTVALAPVITGPTSVKPGQTFDLECSYEGSGNQYTWGRPGRVLPDNSATSGGLLRVYDPTPDDVGLFTCAVGSSNEASHRVTMETAQLSLELQADGVRPDTQDPNLFSSGTQLVLTCQPSAEANIRWERVDNQLSSSAYESGNRLIFRSVTPEDAGTYRCQASLSGGVSTVQGDYSFRVNIDFGRPIRSIEVTVSPTRFPTSGSEVTLVCNADGDDVSYEWMRRDRRPLPGGSATVQGGRTLVIQNFDIYYDGSYQCIASNAFGPSQSSEITLRGIGDPSKLVLPEIRTEGLEEIGYEFVLVCSGGDDAFLTFVKNGEVLVTAKGNGTDVQVRFDPLTADDAGPYDCESVTADGTRHTATFTIELRGVLPPEPPVIRPAGANVAAGSSVSFECGAINALLYLWEKVDGELPDNAVVSSAMLNIPAVSVDDTGEYRCTASNAGGTVSATAQLNVKGAPVIKACPTAQRNAGSECIILVEPDVFTATLDCTASGPGPITYSWTNSSGQVISTERMLDVDVEWNYGSRMYGCTAKNVDGTSSENFLVVKNALIPGFVDGTTYMELPAIRDAALTTSITVSFKPTESTGLLLYNGGEERSTDFVALGLVENVPVFKMNLGGGEEELAGDPLSLNEWHTIEIIRNKKEVNMIVDGLPNYMTYQSDFVGLDLNKPLYLAGLEAGAAEDYAGFRQAFQGSISQLIIQGEIIDLVQEIAEPRDVESTDTCLDIRCSDHGVCVQTYSKEGYECICSRGWAGSDCSFVGVACYHGFCSNDGLCVNTERGAECNCKLGYSGERCDTELPIENPSFNGKSYIQYSPLEDVSRATNLQVVLRPSYTEDGLIAYACEDSYGEGDFLALLIQDGYFVFTYDLGSGPVSIASLDRVQAGRWYKIEAERIGVDGSLSIDGGEAVKAAAETTPIPTTTASGGWFGLGGGGNSEEKTDETGGTGQSIGLNVKTPFFLGGHKEDYLLPSELKGTSGFEGCISSVVVGGRTLELVDSAQEYSEVRSCQADGTQNDDPCLKLPCENSGICLAQDSSKYTCSCTPEYTGVHCETELNACTSNASAEYCLNGGICDIEKHTGEPICRCLIGYKGSRCEIRSPFRGFDVLSDYFYRHTDNSTPKSKWRVTSPPQYREAIRPNDFFKYYLERLKGARGNEIVTGKKACFGGGGYLELPRQLLPTTTATMKVQFTLHTNSSEGVLYWQGQPVAQNGAGADFFALGLERGKVKFSFELGSGPAVLYSNKRVDGGGTHVIIAERKGQLGSLTVDDDKPVTGRSGGNMKHLNGIGNIFLGGVPNHERMVSNNYKSGFEGCISHVKTSAVNGAIDLFDKRISGLDVTNGN